MSADGKDHAKAQRPATADAILDAAELRIRRGGFAAASFRDLAADVGIKSASVHYYFPQKADLGRALVERYSARLMAALGEPTRAGKDAAARLGHMAAVYRGALGTHGAACLCAILGGIARDLPEPVSVAVAESYGGLLDWGRAAYGDGALAELAVSTLQGAMILAVARDDPAILDRAAASLQPAFETETR